jgi:flagellar hook-basal body complex protein FliE
MINSVQGLTSVGSLSDMTTPGATKADPSGGFKDMLLDAIGQVNTMQQDADHAVEALFTGGDVNPAEVLTAVQKADMAFRMMMQVRNKMVAAFEEIKNIRV